MSARYGVFLMPDPATCWAVTQVTAAIRGRFGFVSASAFPPHATLAGNLPVAPEDALVAAIESSLAGRPSFPMENAGVRVLGDVVVYDVDGIGADRNAELLDLALAVDAAVRPLLVPAAGLAPDLHTALDFHAHLSLASHEAYVRPDLRDEVAAFAAALPIPVPATFPGDHVTLYRLEHPTWSGEWWTGMTWEQVRSWHLGGAARPLVPSALRH